MRTPGILFSLCCAALPALAGPVPQVTPPPPPAESGWQFRAAPYLWAESLEGTTGVRGIIADVDTPFSDIWEDLDFAFMGAFEARKGRWSILTDVNYTELSDSISTRDILFTGGDLKMKQFLGNVTINFVVTENEQTSIALYGGTRINWMDVELSLDGVKGGEVNRSGDDFWMDAIVGVRLQHNLGGPWFLRLGGDLGAGESDFTWQAMGIIGYHVSQNCSVGLGYRGLGTDYQNGGFTYDITAHGPVLGAEWRW